MDRTWKLFKPVLTLLSAVSKNKRWKIKFIYSKINLQKTAQPPGVPEVCKKSLESSPVEGGLELFIIGKNFLKDTFVVFKESIDSTQASLASSWEMKVVPDKEYLQQVS